MPPVDFKKLQCPLSLILNVPVDFKVGQCRLSNLREGRVALSNLTVKGLFCHPTVGSFDVSPYMVCSLLCTP